MLARNIQIPQCKTHVDERRLPLGQHFKRQLKPSHKSQNLHNNIQVALKIAGLACRSIGIAGYETEHPFVHLLLFLLFALTGFLGGFVLIIINIAI